MAEGRSFKDTYTIEALLTGDASRLKKAIDRAKALLKTLDDGNEVEIDGNAKPLERSIRIAKTKIAALKKENATIDIKGDATDLNKKVNESFDMVDMLQKKASVIEMNAKGLEALKNFQTIKVKEIDFDGAKVNVSPDFNAKVAEAKVSKFKALLRSIPNRVKTWASVDIDRNSFNVIRLLDNVTDEFQRNMSKMARSIQSFAVVLGNQLKGGLLMMSTAIVPMIAGLVPAVMALGNALGVLVGGLGGLVGAFGLSMAAGAGWGGMMATVLARYNDEAFQATKQSERFSKALDSLKATWNKTVDGNQAKIFDTMSNAIEGVTVALGKLRPMFDGVSKVMLSASKSFKDFLSNSPIAKRFFNMMNTSGVKIFDTLLSAIGKFGAGTMQVFNLLEPLMSSMASGFEDMAGRFMKWSQSVEAEKGFKKFTDYVNTNMPLIRRIFGDTFKGIINLFAAFGQNSNLIFQKLADMSTAFRTWSANLKQSDGFQKFIEYVQRNAPNMISLIGNVIMTLVNLGIALAPLGEKVLDITNKFFNFTKELLANHPVIGQIIGVLTTLLGAALVIVPVVIQLIALWHNLIQPMLGVVKAGQQGTGVLAALKAAFAFLTGPIMAIIVAVGLLVASFIHLWNTNEEFRANVISIWNQIKEHISNAITAVKDFVMDIWGRLSEWWSIHNENIMNVAMVIWTAILDTIQNTMDTIVPIIKIAWEVIKGVVSVALDVILGIVGVVMAILNGDWETAWTTIKDTASRIWETIKTMFSNIWNIIKEAFTKWLENFKEKASTAWTWIKDNAGPIWEALKAKVIEIVMNLVAGFMQKVEDWKAKISTAWETIKQTAQDKWESVKTAVTEKIQNLVQTASEKFEEFKEKIKTIFEAIRTFFTEIWEKIKSFFSTTVGEVYTTASEKFTEIKETITESLEKVWETIERILEKIKTFFSDSWENVKSTVSGATENVKEKVRGGMDNVKEKVKGSLDTVKDKFGTSWDKVKTTVSNATGNVKDKVRGGMDNVRDKVRGSLDNVKDKFGTSWDNVKSTVGNATSNVKGKVDGSMKDVKSKVRSNMDNVKGKFDTSWSNVKTTVSNATNRVKSTVSNALNNVKSTVSNIMNGVKSTFSNIWNSIKSTVSNVVNNIKSAVSNGFNTIRSIVSSIMSAVRSVVSSAWSAIRSAVSSAVNAVRSVISSGFNAARSIVSSVMNAIRSTITNVWNNARTIVSNAVNNIRSTVSNVFNNLRSIVSNAMTNVRNAVHNGMQNAVNVVRNIGSSMYNAGRNVVTSIANGIRSAIGKVTSAISNVAQSIRNHLPFSPAKEGPLRDIMKTNVAGSIAETIDKQRKLPLKAMQKVTKGVQRTIDRYNPTITPDVVGINRGIQSAQQRAQAVMNHTVKAEVDSRPISANITMVMGKREYNTHVDDISHTQNEEAKLNERYGV